MVIRGYYIGHPRENNTRTCSRKEINSQAEKNQKTNEPSVLSGFFFHGTMSFEAVCNSEIVKTSVVYGWLGRAAGKGGNSTQRKTRLERWSGAWAGRRKGEKSKTETKGKKERKREKKRLRLGLGAFQLPRVRGRFSPVSCSLLITVCVLGSSSLKWFAAN